MLSLLTIYAFPREIFLQGIFKALRLINSCENSMVYILHHPIWSQNCLKLTQATFNLLLKLWNHLGHHGKPMNCCEELENCWKPLKVWLALPWISHACLCMSSNGGSVMVLTKPCNDSNFFWCFVMKLSHPICCATRCSWHWNLKQQWEPMLHAVYNYVTECESVVTE